MKRVGCLYRVSTKKQVSDEDDIPMQQQACKEFAQRNGWEIVKEFSEKGVSGFKVSADDRDGLLNLKDAAAKHEIDVLLVFMFDRLGRREDETPFVVEWFVKQGIEVWSVKEGQQCFDSHVDKLMNFIRFWQASGESLKTAERVRTRMIQLTEEGKFTGGIIPFGYDLIHTGLFNQKGRSIREVAVNEKEAEAVRMIFEKTVKNGYSQNRIAALLNDLGFVTHRGKKFIQQDIHRILRCRMYCGYFTCGETLSPKQENLAIIDEYTWSAAQDIRKQRKELYDTYSRIAKTTKANTMLSGNFHCGYCGRKMTASRYTRETSEGKRSVNSYRCPYNMGHRGDVAHAQCTYTASIVDEKVTAITEGYFRKIQNTPKDEALKARYAAELKERKREVNQIEAEVKELESKRLKLSEEIGSALMGQSCFTAEMLRESIDLIDKKINDNKDRLVQCRAAAENVNDTMSKLDFYYEQFLSWSNTFHDAPIDEKKMIICQMFESITIWKGYKIEAVLDKTYQQFFE